MYAENVLGDGAPSKPVEVNLRAFLGHLRAQEGAAKTHAAQQERQQRVAPSMRLLMSSSQGHGDPLVSTTRPSSADGVPDPATGDSGASSGSKPLGPAVDREVKQQQGARLEPSAAGRDAQGAIPQCSASPPAAFDGDFMGLGGFGEDLVDNLFAPPSSSSRRRRRRRLRAPAAGGTLGAHSVEGEGNTGASGPYSLPPIVLVAGISGENRGEFNGTMQKDDGGGGERDNGHNSLYGRSSSVNATNNDVFHAFINLGRRLPGRLRR